MSMFRSGRLALALTLTAVPVWAQTPPASRPTVAPQGQAPASRAPSAPPPTAPTTPQAPREQAPAPAPATTQAPATPPPSSPPPAPRPVQAPTSDPPTSGGTAAQPKAATKAGGPMVVCGQTMAPPVSQPVPGARPVLLAIAPCFEKQGGTPVVEANTYLYYIQTRFSRPSTNTWVPYDETAENTIRDDFRRLWATNFLDDLSIETKDYVFQNGTVGKIILYNMEERQRVKIVDYVGQKQLESTKIDEKLREENVSIRLDTFIDDGLIRRTKSIIRTMLAEKGFLDSTVNHTITPLPNQAKTVNLTFNISEGPKYKIRKIDFVGNKAIGDGTLKRRMKEVKQQWPFSFITGRGVYKETKYEEDAEKVQGYYRDRGYITTQVGNPEIRTIDTTKDGKTRFIELRIPVSEGPRYKIGKFDFADNKVAKGEALRPLFKLKEGDYYAEKHIRKGLEKARELYGSGGYWEFTGYPAFKRHDEADPSAPAEEQAAAAKKPAIVDVTMHMQEGEQFFVNRITFTGNNTTRDNVIRREMNLVENGIFNTEALKHSVKRLNQLGYFKALEGTEAIKVEKTPNEKNQVDLTLKLEEQNRNQLQFGAGYSEYEGTFLQFAFSTSNFLGRGETLSTSVLTGRRYKDYQLSFTEPFLFDRPITGGINVFNRNIIYPLQFTQVTSGGNIMFGMPVKSVFSRMFLRYSLENVRIKDLNTELYDPETIARFPYLRDALLVREDGTLGGRRIISKITPSYVYNTVDNPIFPSSGTRFTASIDLAGVGGNTNYYKPTVEIIKYFQHTRRTSFGVRGQFEYAEPLGDTEELPFFERLVLGGEYSVRGYDVRSIGPYDTESNLVLGGNKSMLFNAEYLIQIAGPVRLVMFYDAGQVRGEGQNFRLREFVASTGAEVRFFMPVLNVPFRLIFARNINETGILDNQLQQEKKYRFRFAVGSTF